MFRKTFLLLAVLAATACSDDSTGVEIGDRYDLRTINGVELPATMVIEGGVLTVQSGFFEFDDDGSFTFSVTGTTNANGSTQTDTETERGFWEQSGSTVFLDFDNGSRDEGTIDGRDFFVDSGGLDFVFRR